MRLAIVQFNPRVGDLSGNDKRIREFCARARAEGARLVVFPELALTGYPPQDLLDYPSFVAAQEALVEALAEEARDISVLLGYVETNTSGFGAPYYNAAALLSEGRKALVYRKQLLPNYGVFDEVRYFEPGEGPCPVVEMEGTRLGITVCEDAWNVEAAGGRRYRTQPLTALKGRVDLVLNLSASPFTLNRPEERRQVFAQASALVGAPLVVCSQVGGNDELLFDGTSLVVSPDGRSRWLGAAFEETLIIADTAELLLPQPSDPKLPSGEAAWCRRALVSGIRDYCRKSGVGKVCLGLSGGIDSSVAAVLAAEAVGPENVLGVSLPTRYTSAASREDAAALAGNLGISFQEFSVEDLLGSYLKNWKAWFGGSPAQLTLENLQPRIRMTVLMAVANEQGRLLLNTSNKSEIATGYATLYGDSAGALAVLGDLTKGQVYALAREFNREEEVIPGRVIERPPTAELREGQTDQETLPPYDVLDTLVQRGIVEAKGPRELAALAGDDWFARFSRLHGASEYKRYQLPPVLRVSPRAFGIGRRMPVSGRSWL